MWIIYIIVLFLKISEIITEEKKLIILPFILRNIEYDENYNATHFLNDHIFSNILINLNIGTPSQNVTSQIDYNSNCFFMQTHNSESLFHSNLYSPGLSNTTKKRSNKRFVDNIYLENHNESNKIEFSIIDYQTKFNYTNHNYTPVLGFDIPQSEGNCPNFFINIKKQGLINKYIWTFEFINEKSNMYINNITNTFLSFCNINSMWFFIIRNFTERLRTKKIIFL